MKNRMHLLNYLKFNSVLKCSKELKNISNSKNEKLRNKLIRVSRDCVINAISEIAKNCLSGNIPLKDCDFNSLLKYQNLLRQISKKSTIGKRRKLLIQKGGVLQFLIPPALSLLATVIGNLIQKKSIK